VMRISSLGVIDAAVLELSPGLTVVTGETGAGKTMVVQGLALLMGGRADSALVRPGCARAVVEGRLVVPADGATARRAAEAGAELDEGGDRDHGALLVGRTISAEGRSRAYLGGRSVPATLLAELADDLVTVHGQSDQLRLLRPEAQRAALDRFAGAAATEPLDRHRRAYTRWQAVSLSLAGLTDQARERAREADLLRFGLAEIDAAAPIGGEDVELAAEVGRLAHADTLRTAAARAHEALLGDPVDDAVADATGLVAFARRALDAAAGHDPALAALAERLAEVSYALVDVAADLASYAEQLDTDPRRLAAAQDRQAVLRGLVRKYGADIEAVLVWAEQARGRLAELDHDDEEIASLTAERQRLLGELATAATALSAVRNTAATQLGSRIGAELAELAMPRARVTAVVRARPAAVATAGLLVDGQSVEFGPDGVDEVELRLEPHAGAPARPLHRGASGGELSRVMLAVEVVFAAADPVPTMVFDEVDAGVGGGTAVEVGRRLARLARSHQVIVVTHLPQVAAFADRHLAVVKSDDGSVTRSGVRLLTGADRVEELSRMLAGLASSALARGHAEELLAVATETKARAPA